VTYSRSPRPRTVAVTGCYGYLGGIISRALESAGFSVRALVRTPRPSDPTAAPYRLGGGDETRVLEGADALVHCAYDFGLTRRADIWQVNVEGSRQLMRAAVSADVRQVITLSSMSAYEGTKQMYGQAKLAIEEATLAVGGCALRCGLVYGDDSGGMTGALRRVTRLPLVPLVAGDSQQFPVYEGDVADAVVALASAATVPAKVIGLAQTNGVAFRSVLEQLAPSSQPLRFVPVAWQVVYAALRVGELARLQLPFRSDSLLGLVHPAPEVPNADILADLGVKMRTMDMASAPWRTGTT